MSHAALLIVFPAFMVFAAFSDLFSMTISNRVSIALTLAFPPVALLIGVPLDSIGWHLACGAAILAIGFGMFSMGWIGGGDAKLAAATAVWLGFEHLLDYGVISAVLGGLLTLSILAFRRAPFPGALLRHAWIARLHDQATGVPYGIALAAAGLLLYPDTQLWLRAVEW